MIEGIWLKFQQSLASHEVQYTGLIFGLFVLPRFFIRLGIPFALSAFAMGFMCSALGWGIGHSDVVKLLSSLGIITLFLFAGLEVEFSELRQNRKLLIQHILVFFGLMVLSSFALVYTLRLEFRPAILLALALLTPSTGFILDTLDASSVPDASKFWIRSKAIGAEIVALFFMFVMVRSLSLEELIMAMTGMVLLILALPLAFRFFMRVVVPVAPKSEFGFLLMIAMLSGMVTKKLGAYYLIGAFIVGIVARRFERSLPKLTSKSMLRSIKSFTGFFIPFYFFYAGSSISSDEFSFKALFIGFVMLALFLPVRIYSVVWHRKLALGEGMRESFPVATSLLPNLVFGLVLAELMKTVFQVESHVIEAIMIYTIGATLAPPILLKYFWKTESEYSFLSEAESRLGGADWSDDSQDR